MRQTAIEMPDPQESPAWRAAAETSRQQFPHMPDRARYFAEMADWHDGLRAEQPRAVGRAA